MAACFHSTPVLPALREYMKAVFSLGYEETPNYAALKKLFTRELTAAGLKDDGKGLDWMATATRKVCSSLMLLYIITLLILLYVTNVCV